VEEGLIRIHVHLASVGLGSRREIERLITQGKVLVNRRPAVLGQKIDPSKDKIRFNGKELSFLLPQESVVVALFKPRGVVTTLKDPENRPTVRDMVPRNLGRLFPVGRLDVMSEGLILMTNDGELAQRLTHPRYEIEKVYEVKVRGNLDESRLRLLEKGAKVDNQKVKPAEILGVKDVTQEGLAKHLVRIKVFEGKNHHVRKLFEAIRCRVIRLKRVSMGPIQLKGLARGSFRVLTPSQTSRLRKEVGLTG